ncbi:MAG: divergent polysaccharide deacetylase family protein [Acidobacteriota bacterium]
MASAKGRPSRASAAPPRRRGPLLLIGLIVLVGFGIGLYFGTELAKPPPPPDLLAPVAPLAAREASAASPAAPPASAGPPSAAASPTPPASAAASAPSAGASAPAAGLPAAEGAPRLAIVIDDLGRSIEAVDALAQLGIPITYAVLPYESRTAEVVARLRARGAAMLCHLPMEALGGADPGPGALRSAMSEPELIAAVHHALAEVPGAQGVNNHMGSAIVTNPDKIRAVLGVVRDEGLYFLDSRTSADTLGFATARAMGIPAAERRIFLDVEQTTDYVRQQFALLLEAGRRDGTAIAIGHPHAVTLDTLRTLVPEAVAAGYRFVPLAELTTPPVTTPSASTAR